MRLRPSAMTHNEKRGKIDPTSMLLAVHHLGGLIVTAIPSAFIMEAA